MRPGEKLFEELLIGENASPSGHPRILCARERFVEPTLLDKMLATLRTACDSGDVDAMLRQVRNLVPEFRPPEEVNASATIKLAMVSSRQVETSVATATAATATASANTTVAAAATAK